MKFLSPLLLLSVPLLFGCTACSGFFGKVGEPSVTILSYNVDNLFDDVHDGAEYPEYDPSTSAWGTALFHLKLQRIAEVLRTAKSGGADVVALQEVESEKALTSLNDLYLKGMGYTAYFGKTDGSPVSVALLSRLPVRELLLHGVCDVGETPCRNVLEADLDCGGTRLALLVNHWKAKEEGAEKTEPLRRAAAAVVAHRAIELLAEDPQEELVVVGDLNESWDEFERVDRKYPTALLPADIAEGEAGSDSVAAKALVLGTSEEVADSASLRFYDPWCEGGRDGSYWYGGAWETIDHVLLGRSLFDHSGLAYGSFSVIRNDFLLDTDGHPFTWDPQTGQGYSDHLPILVTLVPAGS